MIRTTTPEDFSPVGATPPDGSGVYAWARHGTESLLPTGNQDLTVGQAWEYDGNGDLVPTGDPITDDPHWEYDGNGDLVPKLAV